MSTDAAFVIPHFDLTDRLRKAREVTGLGQREFAEEIGISLKSVTNYENGHTAPRQIVMKAWALRTGVPLEWLQTGEYPMDNGPGGSNARPSD
ncbi:helix-turn-helix transcriptional regulator [Citricoccus sp. NPDC055426]|uniref:helix-turn-helix domain-containing protein n=1 Tax=Citricoccus sp. NPDC055426 TaxID=3155536 RepID=UPI00342AFD9B